MTGFGAVDNFSGPVRSKRLASAAVRNVRIDKMRKPQGRGRRSTRLTDQTDHGPDFISGNIRVSAPVTNTPKRDTLVAIVFAVVL